MVFTDAKHRAAGPIFGQANRHKHPSLIFPIRLIVLLALTLSAILLRAPFALAANSWTSPNMTIDTFTSGGLGAAIDATLGASPYTEITSLTVSGADMDALDFAFIRDNLSSIVTIDMSGVLITALPSNVFRNSSSYANGRLDNLQNIVLPTGLTSIGEYAFNHCTSLALTSLPSGVTSIGNNAFYGWLQYSGRRLERG